MVTDAAIRLVTDQEIIRITIGCQHLDHPFTLRLRSIYVRKASTGLQYFEAMVSFLDKF